MFLGGGAAWAVPAHLAASVVSPSTRFGTSVAVAASTVLAGKPNGPVVPRPGSVSAY